MRVANLIELPASSSEAKTHQAHGLRASETCGLRVADMDLKDGAITIQRLKDSLKTVQPLYAHRGQPLLDEAAALRSLVKVRPADGSDYLFTSQKGGRPDRTQFFRIFQAVADATGLRRDTPTASSTLSRLI